MLFGDLGEGVGLYGEGWLVGKSEAGVSLTSKGVTRRRDVGGVSTGPLSRPQVGGRGTSCVSAALLKLPVQLRFAHSGIF